MPDTGFDPNGAFAIEGEITAITLYEDGLPTNKVIDPTKTLGIKVDWQVDGFLTNLWLNSLAAQGSEWRVSCYAESQGPGPEVTLGEVNVPVGPLGALPYTASATINVGPVVPLPEHDPVNGPSGVYKLTVTVFLNDSLAGDFDMIGFHEGPYIQVENPE